MTNGINDLCFLPSRDHVLGHVTLQLPPPASHPETGKQFSALDFVCGRGLAVVYWDKP